ncbi:MAG: biotin/lipoyl-binding protein, partial [Gemmataceae bacterium]
MMSRSSATVCILPLLALGFAGCGGGGHEEAEKKLPAVTFRYPIAKKVPYYAYFTGRTAAREDVDVRARVNGYLVAINFKPGDIVKPNEVLFEIDPRPYQADLDKADARIALVDAEYKLAAANLARERELVEKKATSARDLDVMEAKMKASAAEMSAAKAQKEMAVLNLDWCKVRVPEVPPLLDPKTKEPLIDPKTKKEMAPPLAVGRNLLTLGNLVSANVTQLTTIVSEDP